jgi:hypothetical protein
MAIRRSKKRHFGVDEPIRHPDYHRPVTRRDFLAQGFVGGSATVIAPTILGLLANPGRADAALSQDVAAMLAETQCNIQAGAGKVPFICFDLAGGANIAGSNVMVGQQGGQMEFLTTAGYSKLGIPGNMAPTASNQGTMVNTSMNLAFHFDSAFLLGMLTKISPSTLAGIDGVVIPARSENDTGNNPHNPMYGIARAGARGQLLTLIGSQNSDSGGNSMAPASLMNAEWRPTKIDRTSDATGLVDTGELGAMFGNIPDTVSVMESIQRMSAFKLNLNTVSTGLADDAGAKRLVRCSYVRTAYQTDRFGNPANMNPRLDAKITQASTAPGGTGPIFMVDNQGRFLSRNPLTGEYNVQSGEYEKTAAVMKLVVEGNAGAGTISMGGFDYHDGTRATGEVRDFRAGECIGACLEYAARSNSRLMIYVFSDGSLSSNGMLDNSQQGRGKGVWTGDNQGTAASCILVYNPGLTQSAIAPGRQLGWFRANGDVETVGSPAANSVNNLVDLVILNYLALHNEQNLMPSLFPGTVFSSTQMIDRYAGFTELQTTPVTPPPPPPPPGPITTCNTTNISLNHGHAFTVTPAQLSTTASVTLPVTAGTDGHTHTLTLTVPQMDMLRNGQTVIAASSSDGMVPHVHNITVTCV